MTTRDPIAFLDAVAGYADERNSGGSADRPIRIATIDPAYDSSTYPATLPKVTFDGESTLSGKRYPVLSGYLPRASDRVVLIPCGNTYLIIGSLDSDTEPWFGAGWTSYVPVWASSGTQPNVNNGSLIGQYKAIGKTVFFSVRLLMGSTTTFGTGTYTFTLPPLPAISTTGYVRIGSAYLRDSSASSTGHFEGITLIDPSLSTTAFFVISEPSVISATVPFTWANGDSVNASGFYQTS